MNSLEGAAGHGGGGRAPAAGARPPRARGHRAAAARCEAAARREAAALGDGPGPRDALSVLRLEVAHPRRRARTSSYEGPRSEHTACAATRRAGDEARGRRGAAMGRGDGGRGDGARGDGAHAATGARRGAQATGRAGDGARRRFSADGPVATANVDSREALGSRSAESSTPRACIIVLRRDFAR